MLSPTDLDSQLAHDAMLPVQFEVLWRARATTSPERRLLLAMIERAAADVRLFQGRRATRARRMYADAREWILCNDRSHPLAFAVICDLIGLDPSAVRAAILPESAATAASERWESAA